MALYRRHEHGSMSLDTMMDNMNDDDEMSAGTITVEHFPVVYWEIVGAVIAAFFVRNLIEILICRQRLAAARANQPDPARPRNIFIKAYATLTAAAREASNASIPSLAIGSYRLRSPQLGSVSLVLAYFTLIIVLCFYQFDTSDFDVFEQLAYRAAFVSLAQFPLLFLLAGKNNLVGYVTGYSYERLNWLHRWVARCLLVTVTIHMGYWFALWAPYSGYTQSQLTMDGSTMTGFAAWIILVWIVLSSFAPIRGWSYEVFVVQHIISMIAFTTIVFVHTPSSDWTCLWAAVAVYFIDRLSRALWMAYTNLAIFHRGNDAKSAASGTWTCTAEMQPLSNGMTKMTVHNPPITWQAGQHALVSCNAVVPLQSHPFTITTLPADRKMEFIVKSHGGATKRLHEHAEKLLGLPVHANETPRAVPIIVQGPYGRMRPLRQFDSVVLIAGSTGATFTTPLLRDLIGQMGNESKGGLLRCAPGAVTRHIRYVWVVKSRQQLGWFIPELNQVAAEADRLKRAGKGVSLDMSIYITCDSKFTEESDSPRAKERQTDTYTDEMEAKADTIATTIGIEEIDPRSVRDDRKDVKTCGANGTCCCQNTISDEQGEDAITEAVVCNCASHSADSSSSSSAPGTPLDEMPFSEKETAFASVKAVKNGSKSRLHMSAVPAPTGLHSSITLLSGRPHPQSIVRTSLQQARGESGVVVCGPRGLNDLVREDVVYLSDERAVHKGSGAQGIWFWAEGFGW